MKKFFALASVTALAGVVFAAGAAGCSSSSSGGGGDTDAGKSDAKPDAKPTGDGGGGDDDTDADTGCPAAYPGDPPWKTPAAADATKCTQKDIDFISAQAQKQGETFKQLETDLTAQNAACAKCVFTKEDDAAWGPIVYVGDQGGAFFNFGGCFADATGGSEECGKAVESFELCADAVCPADACGSDNAVTQCIQKVASDKESCGKFNFQSACPNFQTLNAICGRGIDTIAVMCGPGPQDSGQ